MKISKLIIVVAAFFPYPALAIDGEVDIDSWSTLVGEVTQTTCLYSEPSSSSSCLRTLRVGSILTANTSADGQKYTKTSVLEMNPNYRCDFGNSYLDMKCSGGEPLFEIRGYVWSDYYKLSRYRDSCDGYENVYLSSPSISCYGNSCEVDISFSGYPEYGVRVEVEIDTYDANGRRLESIDEDETSYSYSADVDFDYLDSNVSRVRVTDIDCEKW